MAKSVKLTPRELDIMSVLWSSKGASVTDIRTGLSDKLAPQTVYTMLRLLESKGFVRRVPEGKAYIYHAAIRPNDAGDGALKRLVNKVYKGSREMLVSRLLAVDDVSPGELRRIQQLIRDRLKETEP
jgi:BlaI family penicillinase repressor